MTYTATYSPEDNKLRLYASSRLDSETYARVKSAGFKWAPQQQLFVAPMWTPSREDLLLELAGEIGDEDTSLVERAEERSERFEGYSDNRTADAEAARKAVSRIADGIPFGQPILVGHHSERHARRDAEKIENGMRRAVKMWRTAEYWQYRAAGALRHAKYKERPDVRARRIKGLEADLRKVQKNKAESETRQKFWSQDGITQERAESFCNFYDQNAGVKLANGEEHYSAWSALHSGKITVEEVRAQRLASIARYLPHIERWIEHYSNRIAYERAMLAEDGGTVADKTGPEKGGACKCWASPRGGWSYIQKVNKVSVTVLDNWGNGGADFTRTIPFDKLSAVMTAAEVQAARDSGRLIEAEDKTGFGLIPAPAPEPEPAPAAPQGWDSVEGGGETAARPEATAEDFRAMEASLRAGVQVVSANQLFPTPPDVARQMVELARLEAGQEVLEPSAGAGAIWEAIAEVGGRFFADEINPRLCEMLSNKFTPAEQSECRNVLQADFLECNGNVGTFDRIIMNPPFENGADIQHIKHALHMLNPGGRLVAICANGPRQNEQLSPLACYWRELPAGTFAGTGVRAALLTITKEAN